MAGPVTHILLALKLFHSGLLDPQLVDVKTFLLGTSFPDIRYLGVIDRKKTHPKNITWTDIKNEPSPFWAGLKFHVLVDQIREDFIVNHTVYDMIPQSPYVTQCLKMVEDSLLYDKSGDWQELIEIFKTYAPEEFSFGIEQQAIKQWHTILAKYCAAKPSKDFFIKLLEMFKIKITLDPNPADLYDTVLHNEQLQNIIYDFYDTFEQLLE